MTFTQLQYVVRVAQTRSISQAARLLFLSQSYLSNTIRSLEEELGITLFIRKNDGVSLTDDGEFFIMHAQNILNSYDMLMQRGSKKQTEHFALGILMPRTYCNKAFAKICGRYQQHEDVHLTIKEFDNYIQGLNELQMGMLSLYVISTIPENRYHVYELCEQKKIKVDILGTLPIEVYIRKGHPLLKDKNINSSEEDFDFKSLKKYPYVDYSKDVFNGSIRDSIVGKVYDIIPVTSNNDILVYDIIQKDMVLKNTDAYAYGMSRSPSHQNHELENIPIPGCFYEICLLSNIDYSENRLITEYRDLLIEELRLNTEFKEATKAK